MTPIRWIQKERLLHRANRMARRGRTEEALSELKRFDDLQPGEVDLLCQIAFLEADLRRTEDALSTVDRGLAIRPDHPVLLMIRGEVLTARGEYETARTSLLAALDAGGENIRVEYDLGLVCVALGETDRAAEYFESSVRYDRSLVESRLLAMAERYLFETRTHP